MRNCDICGDLMQTSLDEASDEHWNSNEKKKDFFQQPYYPLLFIIMMLSIIFVVLTTLTVIATLILPSYILPIIALLMTTSYPILIAVTNFLLCLNQLSMAFWKSRFLNETIRWFGPLIFACSIPWLISLAALSSRYVLVMGSDAVDEAPISLVAFYVEPIVEWILIVLTMAAYFLIILNRQQCAIDFSVVKQAFPIVCFQMVLGISVEIAQL
ncbi:unnamed protein product [Caenorhabditis bovis]|uniref:Uncharacterized protein n=1 Tax=Caenorhabditis bovis TaxID=2654633 RepID=A0A8S1EP48_9PELO|nr:unnamed protein product [Caenorhabditis bovis]